VPARTPRKSSLTLPEPGQFTPVVPEAWEAGRDRPLQEKSTPRRVGRYRLRHDRTPAVSSRQFNKDTRWRCTYGACACYLGSPTGGARAQDGWGCVSPQHCSPSAAGKQACGWSRQIDPSTEQHGDPSVARFRRMTSRTLARLGTRYRSDPRLPAACAEQETLRGLRYGDPSERCPWQTAGRRRTPSAPLLVLSCFPAIPGTAANDQPGFESRHHGREQRAVYQRPSSRRLILQHPDPDSSGERARSGLRRDLERWRVRYISGHWSHLRGSLPASWTNLRRVGRGDRRPGLAPQRHAEWAADPAPTSVSGPYLDALHLNGRQRTLSDRGLREPSAYQNSA